MGQVGSGKSSLLSAIVAEMSRVDGSIWVQGLQEGFGYVPQQPWIHHGSIRDNILFGNPYIKERYDLTLHACALKQDLQVSVLTR